MSIDAGGGGVISTDSSSIAQMSGVLNTAAGNIQRLRIRNKASRTAWR